MFQRRGAQIGSLELALKRARAAPARVFVPTSRAPMLETSEFGSRLHDATTPRVSRGFVLAQLAIDGSRGNAEQLGRQ